MLHLWEKLLDLMGEEVTIISFFWSICKSLECILKFVIWFLFLLLIQLYI
ncbi:hypothetical protein M6B38_291035 [Iris pallida]|uniref:Uncharacterized protein n=1 Tax=Iris pallida TaxID=29817 RepID=A0AAX6HWP0_IRIPA|nr:hypothetical protein M6B38_291035 [Iris pallida]